ncbi:ExbD/TolR family protein [Longimicrobium sp.]|jgi:biopolymer transport protein ExbD|uniref:ExbD/TolR family protein n=1 Tax=Longimicrobium sp. TaxID=2029185 RepID=UPI002ED93A47
MGWDIVARIREPHTGIDATPFIGLVMVMLVTAMAVPVTTACYFDRLATSVTADELPENRVTIGIERSGMIWMAGPGGGIGIAPRDLSARLGIALAGVRGTERRIVNIRADQDAPYARVLDAVAAARANEVRTLGLITDPPPAARPADL